MIELLIRGAAVGCYVLLAVSIGRGEHTPTRISAFLFCLAAAAHTLTQSRDALAILGVARLPILTLSVAAAGLFWAFAFELFDDSKRRALLRFVPALALLAIALAAVLFPSARRELWLLHNFLGAALMVHVLLIVWTGWKGDLIEARRRLRGPLLAIAALYTLAVVGVQSVELFSRPASELSMLAAIGLLGMGMAGGAVFLRPDPKLFGASTYHKPRIEIQDEALLARLMQAIHEEQRWREEGLTISTLATQLAAPEHHLRRLINEGLGYRNFAAFINERRIDAAKGMLTDTEKLRTSIAAIAFEVGFGSLGPFNRAFRESTGLTPTDWRKAEQSDRSKSES
jgi:AraC-like DNA-binding protein